MKVVTFFVVAVSILSGFSETRAMMNPNGTMMQLNQFDDARALVEAKNFEKGAEALKAVLREFPGHADAWNLLGFSTRMLGDFDKAHEYYDNALTITPGHTGAMNYKGQMFVQTGRLEEARSMLAKLEATCGTDCVQYKQLDKAIKDGKAGAY